ncbi:hypothetical protein NDU88_006213 [Pleurodeles waltl]|uniref:Uncharacterized protein n=1 Tax=Pleurodeles waltl TaxID=8319 RepID=A0AAV7UKC0_PLEWA|nr:hypothetical protein NDU88_006213 [Pleurodeles waltl]
MTGVHRSPKKQEKEKRQPKSATSATPVVRHGRRLELSGPEHMHGKQGERRVCCRARAFKIPGRSGPRRCSWRGDIVSPRVPGALQRAAWWAAL